MNRTVRGAVSILAAFVPALANAAIDGTMAQGIQSSELCVVDNIDAQEDFRSAMVRALAVRGYTARFVPKRDECEVAMAFSATYGVTGGWGPRRVLKSSSFVVYRDAQPIASVRFRYERSMFAGNGTVEEVISQMVFKLLPPAP